MNVMVTGARGFIGRNLAARLRAREGCDVTTFDVQDSVSDMRLGLETADIVYHLAGVNRPQDIAEFDTGNVGLTRDICGILHQFGRKPVIVMSSSVQAEFETPYGVSKRQAEAALSEFASRSGAQVRIYRLKNVFGKWCRPNYNSVVATFCHNIANDRPIQITDPARELDLVYVDDVVDAFLAELLILESRSNGDREIPSSNLTLSDLAGRIQSFHDMRTNLLLPDFAVPFNRQLYATYLSYVPNASLRHQLETKSDVRGELAELLKSETFGQIFISRTRAGVTRGNHYHHTKTEKFFVAHGEAIVRMRQIDSPEVVEYQMSGQSFEVIDIPPGFTHSIENIGSDDLVVLFWASEIFDPDKPDTYFLPVLPQLGTTATVKS